jgi:O-antigen ligase
MNARALNPRVGSLLDSVRGRMPAGLAVLPLLAAIALFGGWTASEGGYPPTSWLPGALFLLILLVTLFVAAPPRLAELPTPVRTAGLLLLAFTLWSFLTIAWADVPGDAWEGADRTLLYLVVFALFASRAQTGRGAALLLSAWTLAMIGIAVVTLLRIPNASDPLSLFIGERLAEPAGYPNAAAATWLMAVWPAVVLAGRRELPVWVRGLLAGGAVVLVDVALMSQSRGSLFALPITFVIFFALVPGRVRSLVVLLPIAAGVGLTASRILDVSDRLRAGDFELAVITHASRPVVVAAMVVAAVVTAGAAIETYRPPAADVQRRAHRAIGAAGLVGAVLGVIVVIALTGSPFARAHDGWDSFKKGYPHASAQASRLTTGLGSNRYDFYRVALATFSDHPLAGVGSDNYLQEYLVRGKSDETPKYPHSLELRTLSQTGLIGAALLLGAFGAALAGAGRAMRRRDDPLAAAVAGGAVMVFAYWVVHGSADWFWEFAGLGAPAFAMLGLACALVPRAAAGPGAGPRLPVRRVLIGVGAAAAAVAALSLLLPWLSERYADRAGRAWARDPSGAYRQLDRAAALDPLTARPHLLAGTIALRLTDYARAEDEFDEALDREPRNAFATLQLGAIASTRGERDRAMGLLSRAVELSPKDPVSQAALARARKGKQVDVEALNERILTRARDLLSNDVESER